MNYNSTTTSPGGVINAALDQILMFKLIAGRFSCFKGRIVGSRLDFLNFGIMCWEKKFMNFLMLCVGAISLDLKNRILAI